MAIRLGLFVEVVAMALDPVHSNSKRPHGNTSTIEFGAAPVGPVTQRRVFYRDLKSKTLIRNVARRQGVAPRSDRGAAL